MAIQGHALSLYAYKKEKSQNPILGFWLCGGDEGDRTPYLLHAMQALSQVSYTPKCCRFRGFLDDACNYSKLVWKCQPLFLKKLGGKGAAPLLVHRTQLRKEVKETQRKDST